MMPIFVSVKSLCSVQASQTPSGADSEGRRTAVSHQRQSQRPLIGNQNPVPGVRLPPRGGSVGLTEDGRPRRLIIDRQGLPGVDPRPDLGGRSTSWQAGANEVGCCVLVRLWRYSQMGKPALEKLELAIQNAVLCSDMGVSISQCGKLLAVCASIEVSLPFFPFFVAKNRHSRIKTNPVWQLGFILETSQAPTQNE